MKNKFRWYYAYCKSRIANKINIYIVHKFWDGVLIVHEKYLNRWDRSITPLDYALANEDFNWINNLSKKCNKISEYLNKVSERNNHILRFLNFSYRCDDEM